MNKDVCRAQVNLPPTGVSRGSFSTRSPHFCEKNNGRVASLTMIIIMSSRVERENKVRETLCETAVCIPLSDWSELRKKRDRRWEINGGNYELGPL